MRSSSRSSRRLRWGRRLFAAARCHCRRRVAYSLYGTEEAAAAAWLAYEGPTSSDPSRRRDCLQINRRHVTS
ncbi:hypothetical protein ACRALDRAFT_2021857 [Sodiomyces alcalophilus JCM 7366]|uniref:uncharacterized protein n=1 Tax=Sodiomyces alcalophilus JCM 7366 TaxID=591952 RepID=UPI0039B675FA